ncbi:MAG TPA: GGDEF domain-containing protein [Thermoanaerobaculia bacterium]
MNTSGEGPESRDPARTSRPPQIAGVLALVQELTRLAHSESAADLFSHALGTLAGAVPFDVGAAVMLEQHLDLYITTRADAGRHLSDALVSRVRTVLRSVIPPEFTTNDVIVKDERAVLRPGTSPAGVDHDVHSVLKQENRTAGLVLVCRRDPPFNDDERHVVEIFAMQVSMLLDNLRARAKILSLADVDDLTGVPNRRYFRRQLTSEMERCRVYNVPLSLLVIDVDNFKEINDTFGHVMGDVVLSELCGTIRESLRTPDSVARFGGDEFAVILPHTDSAGAAKVAERILKQVEDMTIASDEEGVIRCTVSIGVAQFQPADVSFNDIVRRADACLYDAKRQGKNRFNL